MTDILPPGLTVDLSREASGWSDKNHLEQLCGKAISAAFAIAGLQVTRDSEVSLLFTDDVAIRELNKNWRNKDKPTNVLSFPGSDPDGEIYGPLLGDIVFALETVKKEASELGIDIDDHVTHLTVHGLLHLFDYDHQEDDEAELMEGLEIAILKSLGIADPYSESPLVADGH